MYLSVSELVKELGLSKWRWQNLADTGKVKTIRFSPTGYRYFDVASCREYLNTLSPTKSLKWEWVD